MSRAIVLGLFFAPVLGVAQPLPPSCNSNGLDGATFGALLNRRFSSLISSETEGVPGTYLTVDVKEAAATVGTTFIAASGHAVTVSAHGGVGDGAVAIFKDATLAGKFGGSAQLHFLGNAKRILQYDAESCDAMQKAVLTADAKYELRKAELRMHSSQLQRRIDVAAIEAVTAKIAKKRQELADSLKNRQALPDTSKRRLTPAEALTRDSLDLEEVRNETKKASLLAVPAPTDESERSERLAALHERDKVRREAASLIDVQGYAFSWWSLGVELENASFSLFDPAAAAAAQISKRTHLTRFATLTYSRIRSAAEDFESRYVALAVKVGWQDNLSDLKKVNVVDRQQLATPPSERVTETTTTAYQGAYLDDVETIRVTGDLYQFFVRNDRLAYHVFPAYSAKTGGIGEIALGGGLLLSARNPAKKMAVANAEVFFNAPDLADVRKSHKSPLKRGVLGLRVTFPFNFTLGS
jgi:hypothetical protein